MPELSMNEAAAKLHALAQESLEKPETVSEETTEPEEEIEPEETLEAVSEETEDIEDVNQEEPIESEEPSPEVSTEPEAETIEIEAEQLAEILNLKPEQLVVDDEGIRFKSQADGEDVDVNLVDLINAHQGERVLTNRSKEIAKLEQAQKDQLNRLAEQSNQFAQQAASILENLKTKFVNPYTEAELNALREDDPAEYAARKTEIKDREAEYNSLVQNALATTQQVQSTQNEEYQRQYAEYLRGEGEKVLQAVPNWKTIEADVVKYASEDLGFTNEEIGQMADSRLLKALYNSMQFEKGAQGAKQKKVRKVPKVVKSGPRQDKGQASLEAQSKARARLKKTGSMEDAVAILRSRR